MMKAPDSARSELIRSDGPHTASANARLAWKLTPPGLIETMTGKEAQTAKLQAMLSASRFVDYKKLGVLARTVGLDETTAGEPAYVVEFSTRQGGRVRCWFSLSSKLLLKNTEPESGVTLTFSERRLQNGVLEAHRVVQDTGGRDELTFVLRTVLYNTGLSDTLFEPPGEASLDIPALLREVGRNQDELDQRVSEYTFTRRQIEREINDRGEVKKEKVTVHEVYPAPGGGAVYKLVSEDGVQLSPEKQEKEARRVAEELEKLERENEKRRLKREGEARRKRERGAGKEGEDDLGGIAAFLRACEFVSPRRERFHGRDTIVFDFRARPNFKPSNDSESIIAKLVGTIWIDPADKQVMRLEARLDRSIKIAGGLVASIRPGSSFAFEQTRMEDGVWLPRTAEVSAFAKVFIFAGFRLDATREYSDYKRFTTRTEDATLDAPPTKGP
jgi:hypothetical protein